MKNQIMKLMTIVFGVFLIGNVYGQSEVHKKNVFDMIDTNRDDKVSLVELQAYTLEKKDKKRKTYSAEKIEKRFLKMDGDQNGYLTRNEIKKGKKKKKGKIAFNKMDLNNDLRISVAEMRTYKMQKAKKKDRVFADEKFEKRFAEADIDNDGYLTKQELKAVEKNRKVRKSTK